MLRAIPRAPPPRGGVTMDNGPELAEAEAEAEAREDGDEEHLPDASERVLKLPLAPTAMPAPPCFGRLFSRLSAG